MKKKILEEIVDIIVENSGVSIEDKDCPVIVEKILKLIGREGLATPVEIEEIGT